MCRILRGAMAVAAALVYVGLTVLSPAESTHSKGTAIPPVYIIPDFEDSPACMGFLTQDGSSVLSTNYPAKYPKRMDCRRILTAPPGYAIVIDIVDFAMEHSRGCEDDFFEIRDGPFGFSPKMAKLCGRIIPPSVVSSGSQLWIRMKTDELVEDRGVRATVKLLKDRKHYFAALISKEHPVDLTGSCNVIINATDEGVLSTRSTTGLENWYLSNSEEPRDCSWDIRASNHSKIFLVFSDFAVVSSALSWKCADSVIEVYDGGTSDDDIVRKECFAVPAALVTRSPRLVVRIKTGHTTASLVFSLAFTVFHAEEACDGMFRCGDGQCISRNLECNGRLNCKDSSDEHCHADSIHDSDRFSVPWKYPLVLGVSAGATLLLITGVLVHNARLRCSGRASVLSRHPFAKRARPPPNRAFSHAGRLNRTAAASADALGGSGSERALLCRLDSNSTHCTSCGAPTASRRITSVLRSQTTESSATVQTVLSTSTALAGLATPLYMSPAASVEDEEKETSDKSRSLAGTGPHFPSYRRHDTAPALVHGASEPPLRMQTPLIPGDPRDVGAVASRQVLPESAADNMGGATTDGDAMPLDFAASSAAISFDDDSKTSPASGSGAELIASGSGAESIDQRLPPDARSVCVSAAAPAGGICERAAARAKQRPLTRGTRVDDCGAVEIKETEWQLEVNGTQ